CREQEPRAAGLDLEPATRGGRDDDQSSSLQVVLVMPSVSQHCVQVGPPSFGRPPATRRRMPSSMVAGPVASRSSNMVRLLLTFFNMGSRSPSIRNSQTWVYDGSLPVLLLLPLKKGLRSPRRPCGPLSMTPESSLVSYLQCSGPMPVLAVRLS